MPFTTVQRELIVFPTELSLRRYQQEQALERGGIDASGHTTFARLRTLCLPFATLKGKPLGAVKELLLRKQVVEVAQGHFVEGGPLGLLSEVALADVLEKLLVELAALPEETARIMDWMLSRSPKHKLYQLGMLFSIWRATLQQEGLCDVLDVNTAILKLLKGNREKWPPLLRDAKQLTFRSVRWFNPFEESCVLALNQKMRLRIESALPPAHAEMAADKLGQKIRAEIMENPWSGWAEDLGDALAVNHPDVLQLEDAGRISFSRSAGAYGEIEDLARRICWNLQSLPANRIALVVPNIGTVQDIIPHVFGRFQIPYYFRRGRPVLSSPCAKAFFAWLAFPLRPERDVFIDLVRNPAIHFDNREENVRSLLKTPPRLDADRVIQPARSGVDALEILKTRIVEPEDHFNSEALAAIAEALEGFGEQQMPLHELVDLLEKLLKNATVRPRDSHDQGVWILNPRDDAVGLDFDLVLFAGLNEGEFPGVPQQDALFSDKERHSLRLNLEEQGRSLSKLALPTADVLFEQQSIQFLSAFGMAREQLVLSFQAVDQAGNEKGAGEYYRKLWNLAGWCVHDEITMSPYDQWRIEQLQGSGLPPSVFFNHLEAQQETPPEDRIPMPGESFLPIIPIQLCRAKDEALQAAVQDRSLENTKQTFPPVQSVTQLVERLNIEAERDLFLEPSIDERVPSKYCGHIGALQEKIRTWFERREKISPTALEVLAQCRYIFLLERVFGLCDPRLADDSPDPMERGGLIHSILQEIYSTLAKNESEIDAPRNWAIKTATGWVKRAEGGTDAIPLVTFVPELLHKYTEFATQIAKRRMNQTPLGHPGVWAAEQEKILEMVLNFVRYDVATCAAENRFPAQFEMDFEKIEIDGLAPISVHGTMDRVDLIFSETGELKRVRVLDYKGSSRVRSKTEDYLDEIRRNLDCQLPIYAFAAQTYFWGVSNTPEANAMTEAGYLFYQRDFKEVGKTLKKSLISMDEPGMIEGFLDTLTENIRRLKSGDFAVDPMIAAYTDHQSVCRTEAVDREDLDE